MKESTPRNETDDQAEAVPFPPKPPIAVPIRGSGQAWTERQKKRDEMRGPKGKGKGFKGKGPPWKGAKKGKAKGKK